MNNEDIKQIAMRQSAIDMNCMPEDFENQGNKVVLSKLNPGAKKCYKKQEQVMIVNQCGRSASMFCQNIGAKG